MERLNEVLAKSSWDEQDIKFLLQNVNSLPESAKQKLGLAPKAPIVAVEEPVRETTPSKAKTAVKAARAKVAVALKKVRRSSKK